MPHVICAFFLFFFSNIVIFCNYKFIFGQAHKYSVKIAQKRTDKKGRQSFWSLSTYPFVKLKWPTEKDTGPEDLKMIWKKKIRIDDIEL